MEGEAKEENEGKHVGRLHSKRMLHGKITEAFPIKKARKNHEGETGAWGTSVFASERRRGTQRDVQGGVVAAGRGADELLEDLECKPLTEAVEKVDDTASGSITLGNACAVAEFISTKTVVSGAQTCDENNGRVVSNGHVPSKHANLEENDDDDLPLSQFRHGHISTWCRGLGEREVVQNIPTGVPTGGSCDMETEGLKVSTGHEERESCDDSPLDCAGIAALEDEAPRASQLLFGESRQFKVKMNDSGVVNEKVHDFDTYCLEGRSQRQTELKTLGVGDAEEKFSCLSGAVMVASHQHLNNVQDGTGVHHFDVGNTCSGKPLDDAVKTACLQQQKDSVSIPGVVDFNGKASILHGEGRRNKDEQGPSVGNKDEQGPSGTVNHEALKVMTNEVDVRERYSAGGVAVDMSFSPGDSFWEELIEVEQRYVRKKELPQGMEQGPETRKTGDESMLYTPEAEGNCIGVDLICGRDQVNNVEGNSIGVEREILAVAGGGVEADSPLPVRQISFSPLQKHGSLSVNLVPPPPALDFAFPVPKSKPDMMQDGGGSLTRGKFQAEMENMSEGRAGGPSSADLEWWGPSQSAMKRCQLRGGAKSKEAESEANVQSLLANEVGVIKAETEKFRPPPGGDCQMSEKSPRTNAGEDRNEGTGPGLMSLALLPSEKADGIEAASIPFHESPGKAAQGKAAVQGETAEADVTPAKMEVSDKDLQLSAWLPSDVAAVYAQKGVTAMYRWQAECLQQKGVLEGKNLVYCASTSAGKSLVAEIMLVRRLMSMKGKTALLVLPYVALCSEKASHLEAVLEPLGKRVRSFFGFQGGSTLPKDTAVAVCTIEKANSLVNKLLEEGRLFEIALVIIDELHMVGDADRGYLLELLLTKLRYAGGGGEISQKTVPSVGGGATSSGVSSGAGGSSSADQLGESLQIVGMSATMPNVSAIAKWLQASLYQTDFRPVPLDEYMKIGNGIYDKKWKLCRMLRKEADYGGKDPDHVVELCQEVVREGHSVLVFCSSRKGCETAAQHIAGLLTDVGPRADIGGRGDDGPADGSAAVEELKKTPAGLDPVLAKTVPAGVAHHHAGLTGDEREVIEGCFKRGVIRVLCATSTLAAGVNLPARRVIFRHPLVGRDFLDGTRYRQMAGRAGRAGIDTKGESILILRPEQQRRAALMLEEGVQPLQSCLTQDRRGMTRTLLEVVAGGLVQTAEEVQRYVRCTLLAATKPFEEVVKPAQEALRWLCMQKFVEWEEQTKMYAATPLGRAAFGSSLTPEEALTVFDDLAKARQAFVLASDLHILYQVTPIYVGYDPDWGLFYRRFVELAPLDQKVGNFVGVTEAFLMRMAHGGPMMKLRGTAAKNTGSSKGGGAMASASAGVSSSMDETLRVCRRFFVSLILAQLIQEVPLARVCDLYEVPKGTVQGLQDQAGRFSGMVAAFCERLGWQDLEALVKKFQNRVCFGVRSEIVDLTQLPHVKAYRARALYRAGFRTPQAVAEASPQEIAKALAAASFSGHEGRGAAGQQRMELMTARKIINGARKKVLEQVEEARTAAFSALRALGLPIPTDLAPAQPQPHPRRVEAHPPLDESLPLALPEPMESSRNENQPESPRKDEAAVTSPPKRKKPEAENAEGPQERAEERPAPLPLPLSPAAVPSPLKRSGGGGGGGAVSALLFGSEVILREEEAERKAVAEVEVGRVVGAGRVGPVDVDRIENGFARFYEAWDAAPEFVFELHSNRSGTGQGSTFEFEGLAVALPSSPVYYINLSRPPIPSAGPSSPLPASKRQRRWLAIEERWEMVAHVFEKTGTRKVGWDVKNTLRAFCKPTIRRKSASQGPFGGMGAGTLTQEEGGAMEGDLQHMLRPIVPTDTLVDVRVVAWILAPDEESNLPQQKLGLEQMVVRRLPAELAAAAAREGRWVPPGGRVAHNGCCRRVAQLRALHSVLWKMLRTEALLDPLEHVEMPLVKVLAGMEENGIAVDMATCQRQRQVVERKLLALHTAARFYSGGMSFSLSAPAEVADILYRKLGLPIPPGCAKGKNHPSTDKQALEYLKDQHPLVGIIMEHRSLSKLLNTTLGQIVCHAKPPANPAAAGMPLTSFIFGRWLQTSTSTGRLSMEDPNLQCVENAITFTESGEGATNNNPGPSTDTTGGGVIVVNPRDIFVPSQPGWVLMSADYSQIELRLMAHFSRDRGLIDLLTSPSGDVFRMIASRWAGLPESAINDKERNRAKRLTYGILYGMGATSLAESMACTADEAQRYSQQFLRAFPGVARWIEQSVESCRQTGHITTLAGRRRYLEKINDKWWHSEQARAERQAVNSICQGSAADLIKHAMILLHSALQSPPLAGKCRLLLQIHDELVLEVDRAVLCEAARSVQASMESAATLQVPLRVKMQVGSSWGSLEMYNGEQLPMEEDNVAPPFRMRSPTGRVRVLDNDANPLKRGG